MKRIHLIIISLMLPIAILPLLASCAAAPEDKEPDSEIVSFVEPTSSPTSSLNGIPSYYRYFNEIFPWVDLITKNTLKRIIVEDGYIGVSLETTNPEIKHSEDQRDIDYNISVLKNSPLVKVNNPEIEGGSYRLLTYVLNSGEEYSLLIENGRVVYQSNESKQYFRFDDTPTSLPNVYYPSENNREQKKIDEKNYTPDYESTNTLHADVFLEKLKKDGYHRGDEIDKDYNTDNIKGIYNITPQAILEENPDLEFFYLKDGYHCFMMYRGEIYRYDTFGGYHHRLVLWDYDGNGVKDLVSYQSYGSGISYLSVLITDLTTMETREVITRNTLSEPGFRFSFDRENVYIDDEKLVYDNGAFHCGD